MSDTAIAASAAPPAITAAAPLRALIAGAMAVNALGVLVIMLPRREHVKKIYNVNV